jgi:hypothetical protein
MIELSTEQRRVLKEASGELVRALDPDTRREYVMVPAEIFERLQSVLYDEDEFVECTYRHVMEVFGREGWNDPSMDIYDDLDPRKQP